MAGGPLYGRWTPVTAGSCYFTLGAESGGEVIGLGVKASLGANATWRGLFQMPLVMPTGSPKLRLLRRAAATSGNAIANPQWGLAATETAIGGVSLNSEGNSTLAWASGDSNKMKEDKIALDQAAMSSPAGKLLRIDLIFISASWTLAQPSWWLPTVIWE